MIDREAQREANRAKRKAWKQRGHLETPPHVLKAVLHNEEHPNDTPHGRNRHERRAIAAAVRKGVREMKRVKKQMVRP